MIKTITLKNFMSHAETVIDLAAGLTVLTGPNNCGKSAIVAALQTLATNGRTKHVTRHGEKIASVTVETDEGDCVQWERKGTVVKYVINGEDVHRVGQGIPDGLHDVLKLDRVDLETGKSADRYDIHFGEQKSPVFLLGDTGSRAAQFFASSSDVSRLIEMQSLHRTQVRDQKKEKKRLEKQSKENIARLAVLAPIELINGLVGQAEYVATKFANRTGQCERIRKLVDSIERKKAECNVLAATADELARLDTAATSLNDLQRDRDRCERLTTLRANIRDKNKLKQRLSRVSESLRSLVAAPTQHPLQRIQHLADRLSATEQTIGRLTRVSEAIVDICSPPEPEPADACRILLKRLDNARREANRLESLSKSVEELRPLPDLQPTDRLKSLIKKARGCEQRLKRVRSANKTLSNLATLAAPKDPTRLSDVLQKLKKLTDARTVANAAASDADVDLKNCAKSIETFVLDNPTCTVCGGDVDAATLMSTASKAHVHSAKEKSTKGRPSA